MAIERLTAAQTPTGLGLTALALHAFVYCILCLLLLFAEVVWREQIRSRLRRVSDRLGSERVLRRSVPVAAGMSLLAVGVAAVAITL